MGKKEKIQYEPAFAKKARCSRPINSILLATGERSVKFSGTVIEKLPFGYRILKSQNIFLFQFPKRRFAIEHNSSKKLIERNFR